MFFQTKKSISSDIKSFLGEKINFSTWENILSQDKSQKSKVYGNDFKFKDSNDIISISVYDYSETYTKKMKFYDHTFCKYFFKRVL